MCEKSSILIIFLIFKIFILIILPIILFILYKRENKNFKLVGLINIILLILLLVLRLFNNSCVANSNIDIIKAKLLSNNEEVIYEGINSYDASDVKVEPNKKYQAYGSKSLYYFNQNNEDIKNLYYECDGNIVYFNTFGSAITSYSIVLSTLYNESINPAQIFYNYKLSNNLCDVKMTINNVYSSSVNKYGELLVKEIDSSRVESEIINGGLVVVELAANSNSKLTCDSDYIVIYNIDRDGKYLIAIPSLTKYDIVCPYSSSAYGRIIKSTNMDSSWNPSDIKNEAVHYYSIKRNLDWGHD